jgi:hypothetical protein
MWAVAAYYMVAEPALDIVIGLAIGFFTLSLWLSGWIEGQSKALIASLLSEFNAEYEAHKAKVQSTVPASPERSDLIAS